MILSVLSTRENPASGGETDLGQAEVSPANLP
jgi:hypothetical protein